MTKRHKCAGAEPQTQAGQRERGGSHDLRGQWQPGSHSRSGVKLLNATRRPRLRNFTLHACWSNSCAATAYHTLYVKENGKNCNYYNMMIIIMIYIIYCYIM